MAGKAQKSGKSKRPQSERKKNARAACRRRAEVRHGALHAAQERRHAANVAAGGLTPWQLSELARAARRVILAAAWHASPWHPGDAAAREKSVREWTLAHRKDEPVAADA